MQRHRRIPEPVPADAKLRVQTDAQVLRIIVENGRAVGVEYLHRGRVRTVRTSGEVLLASGAFVSPKILMLSGIGPAEHLRALGIPVVADLPGVGSNLQDHAAVSVDVETHGIEGYSGQHSGLNMIRNGVEYLLFRSGRAATNGVEACSFHVPEDGSGDPVVQIYCVPTMGFMDKERSGKPREGMSLGAVLLRPRSAAGCGCGRPIPRTRRWSTRTTLPSPGCPTPDARRAGRP